MKKKAFLEVGKLYTNKFNKFPDVLIHDEKEQVFYRLYSFWRINEKSLAIRKNIVFMYLGGYKTYYHGWADYYYPFIADNKIVYIREKDLYDMKRCPRTLGIPKTKINKKQSNELSK